MDDQDPPLRYAPTEKELGVDTSRDAKRFGLFLIVLVVCLGMGAFLVVGALVYEVGHPEERPPAPPKYSIPSFTPPDRALPPGAPN